jgi:hypothetical protein
MGIVLPRLRQTFVLTILPNQYILIIGKQKDPNMFYIVLEKDARTETIISTKTFFLLEEAQNWVDKMSSIWEEDRGYKIMEQN